VAPSVGHPAGGHPARVGRSFDGLGQDDAALARPADVNAAVGLADVVEVANRALAVYTKGGTRRCAVALADLLGTPEELWSPRVQYDARYGRYSVAVAVEPASAQAPAAVYLATTRAADPCQTWWTYRLSFSGPLFPPGTRLDSPRLGQDRVALLLSSDNFDAAGYVGSAAFAVPKSAVYGGAALSYPAFEVAFATAPVNSDQATAAVAADSFYLAAEPGHGYLLYRMINSAGPGTVLLTEATVDAVFAAPARRIRQCTAGTLDPLDGRIASPPVRAGDFVWFTHGIDDGGRPAVRYGAISLRSYNAYLATAARSPTSDDFNPSIAVGELGSGFAYIWLNWAFTDVAASPCTDVSPIADSVAPGEGLPDLVGSGVVFARGTGSGVDAPFGAYSSAAVDPAGATGCPTGRSAVFAQQYFGDDGRWRTRLAQLSSC